MTLQFTPSGVCSRQINLEVEDGIVRKVEFIGGCSGNAQGISALVAGMPVDEVISRLKNIKCGSKATSCPAQLAKALMECKSKS